MADIVNLGDKLKAQREETARLDLTTKMIPIMVETVERFAALGVEVLGSSPEEFTATVTGELRKYSQVAKEANIRAE